MCTNTMTNETKKSETLDLEKQMDTVSEKVKRTSTLLHEIQDLSPICKEAAQEHVKEREVRKHKALV